MPKSYSTQEAKSLSQQQHPQERRGKLLTRNVFQRKLQHTDIVLQINQCFLDSSSREKLICIEEKALSGIPSIMLMKRCREARQTDCPAVQAERGGQQNSPSSQGLLHLKLQKKSEEKLEQRELEDVEKKNKSKKIGMRRIKNEVSMRKRG